jgi:hypothetical protein
MLLHGDLERRLDRDGLHALRTLEAGERHSPHPERAHAYGEGLQNVARDAVWGVRCAVWGVRCAVCGVRCAMWVVGGRRMKGSNDEQQRRAAAAATASSNVLLTCDRSNNTTLSI